MEGARRGVDGCGRGEDRRWREPRTEGAKYAGKLRLKGLQMDMIMGEKRWTEVVDEACFRVSLKYALLWSEILKQIGVEGDADGHLLEERGVVVGGKRSCTKHVLG